VSHRRPALLVAVALLLAPVAGASPARAGSQAGPAYVTRVVDGNTLYAELGGRLEAVRYIGVNVPVVDHPTRGREPYAGVVREMNRRLVESQWIRLVFEDQSRDRDGRLLAYVWVGDLFINAALVHWGYAEAAAPSPTNARYAAWFRSLEEGARRDGRGLWRYGDVQAYYRPGAAEREGEGESQDRAATASGGRVFSAPAPFIPPLPAGTRSSPAPVTPATPGPAPGGYGASGPTLPYQGMPRTGTTYVPQPGR
jgi:micrococcal nuclease